MMLRARIRHIRGGILIFIMIIWSFNSYSQTNEDILAQLKQTSIQYHDSLYYELFKIHLSQDIGQAKDYAYKSFEVAKNVGHPRGIAKACRALAYVYNMQEMRDSCSLYLYKGIQISKDYKLRQTLMSLSIDLGLFYEKQDFYDSALKYYGDALEIAVQIDSKEGQAAVHNNIGLVFYYLSNYDEALNNLQLALEIKRKNKMEDGLSLNLMNIALIYNDQGKYNNAIEALREVEERCKSGCSTKINSELFYGLGYSYKQKGQLDLAKSYLVKSVGLARECNNIKALANGLYNLSLISYNDREFKVTLDYLAEAETLSKQINLRRLQRDIYGTYKKVFEEIGDLTKVVEFQNKYMSLKDSIFNEQLATNLKEIQLDAQRKQSDVIIQQKESEIERVRLITTLIGVISVLLVIVTLLIYRNYRVSHRMKGILEKEIEKRTGELVKSNADLTQMTQEYDQLVYRASHDIRGPLATLMGLTNIAKQDYEEPNRVRDYLSKIESTALGLNQTLSQLMETNRIRNLPICVEEVDMNSLLDEAYSSFKTLNHFPLISLRIEKGDWKNPLLSDKNLVSFIITKLLDNAFRYFSIHKREKYIKVSWSQEADKTIIAVEDNGLGINAEAKEKIFQLFYVASDVHGSGLGLFLAQMAANRLGGRIILARSADPTIFKLVITTNLAKAQVEDRPLMTVSG